MRLSFEPADIVNEVMSFGSPTPIEVVVSGPKMADNRAYAEKLHEQLAGVPSLRDLQYGQSLDYPTVDVQIDREKAALTGVTAEEVARSLRGGDLVEPLRGAELLARSRFGHRLSGAGRDSAGDDAVGQRRGNGAGQGERARHPSCSATWPTCARGRCPAQVDRYNMRRLVSMTANIEGEDLGRVAERIARAVEAAGEPPARGSGRRARPGDADARDVPRPGLRPGASPSR